MHGRGIFKWPDKKMYEGEYNEDKRHGFGIFTWPDGRKYKGGWNNGKQHGISEIFNPTTKTWRKGVWNNGKRREWIDTTQTTTINNKEYLNGDVNLSDDLFDMKEESA